MKRRSSRILIELIRSNPVRRVEHLFRLDRRLDELRSAFTREGVRPNAIVLKLRAAKRVGRREFDAPLKIPERSTRVFEAECRYRNARWDQLLDRFEIRNAQIYGVRWRDLRAFPINKELVLAISEVGLEIAYDSMVDPHFLEDEIVLVSPPRLTSEALRPSTRVEREVDVTAAVRRKHRARFDRLVSGAVDYSELALGPVNAYAARKERLRRRRLPSPESTLELPEETLDERLRKERQLEDNTFYSLGFLSIDIEELRAVGLSAEEMKELHAAGALLRASLRVA